MMNRSPFVAALVGVLAMPALAQVPVHAEGEALPRHSTADELAYLARNPLSPSKAATAPPVGPIRCVAEYERMSAILVSWEGLVSWQNILAEMARHITTTGDADLWVSVDTTGERTTAANTLTAGGADMSRVHFVVVPTDSIWIRDYGPRYIFQGQCRAIIDHTYNQPRPLDNAFNKFYRTVRGHAYYEIPLVHGGGNYHLNALGSSRTTRLIVNENPSLTEQQIFDLWASYQNVATNFYQPFPRAVDATQHIDMWMQVTDDDAVMISDWPFNAGSIQDQICDATAASMAAEGYTVTRVPARSVSGVHYTYTNVVMCNDIVLVPTYTNAQVQQHNADALSAWATCAPTKTIIPINCQAIVSAFGVMHCIVQHIPEHLGGTNPTAYQIRPNGGEVLTPNQSYEISYATDDDEQVVSVDVLLSTDGGATYPTVIAASATPTGYFVWNVPDVCSGAARIKVVARDAQGNTGSEESDANFVINGTGCAAASLSYGSGSTGQFGVPTLTGDAPVLGGSFDIDLGNAYPSSAAALFIGAGQAAIPLAGGTVLVQPLLSVTIPVSAGGTANLSLAAPSETAFAGLSLYWQAWIVGDPGGVGGLASTAGLETRFGL